MATLSDKQKSSFEHIDELRNNDDITFYHEEDVKEFIKQLKERLTLEDYQILMIDELAGDKLNGN